MSLAQQIPAGAPRISRGQSGLSVLRDESQQRFEELTAVLCNVRQALDTIGGDFDRLMALVDEVTAARIGIENLQLVCAGIAEKLQSSHAAISTGTLTNAITEGLDAVDILQRECRQLNAIASMTRITGHSIRIDAIEGYIESLRGMIQRLSDTTFAMQARLKSIGSAVHHAFGQLGEAADCTFSAISSAESDGKKGVLTQFDAPKRRIATQLGETILVNTDILMSGIQFSDALAQRLEHIEYLLKSAPGSDAVEALISAQIRGLCDDATEMLRATTQAMAELGQVGEAAAETLAGDSGNQTALLLKSWRTELKGAQQIERLVTPALKSAMTAVANIDTAITDARRDLKTLSETAMEVSLATVNAGLMAMRSGNARSAMNVLSSTVRERANVCNEQNERCRQSFEAIDEATKLADFADLSVQAGQLGEQLRHASANMELSADMFARLAKLQQTTAVSASGLRDSIAQGMNVLENLPEMVAQIVDFAGPRGRVTPGPGAAAELAAFYDIYTMQREREIHNQLIGAPHSGKALQDENAQQSLDDILF